MDQPTISLSELKTQQKSRMDEITNFWKEKGYERTPDGKWQKTESSTDLYQQELQTKKLEQDVVAGEKEKEPQQYEREAARSMSTIDEVVKQVENLSSRVNNFNSTQRNIGAVGLFKWLGAKFQFDPDATELDSKRAYLSQIVRTLGEKGNLSEGDVSRAINAIPGVTDTKDVAQRKIKSLKNILSAANQGFEQGSGNKDPLKLFGE